jgi:hypothetical protein
LPVILKKAEFETVVGFPITGASYRAWFPPPTFFSAWMSLAARSGNPRFGKPVGDKLGEHSEKTAKTEVSCHSTCGTIKIPISSVGLRSEQSFLKHWLRLHIGERFSSGTQNNKQSLYQPLVLNRLLCKSWISAFIKTHTLEKHPPLLKKLHYWDKRVSLQRDVWRVGTKAERKLQRQQPSCRPGPPPSVHGISRPCTKQER